MTRLTPPLKYFGGKYYLAPKIVAMMPKHIHYVEPYFGGGSVLLHKDPEGVSEMINDINGELANFWSVLKDETLFRRFARKIEATPMARHEWESARDSFAVDLVERAAIFFVRCRQSHSGTMKTFTGITRKRTRRGMNGNVSEWLGAVDGLPAVHARLRRVLIESMDAIDLIRREDTSDTLFYLDPPYLHETRSKHTNAYDFEMTDEDHRNLLRTIVECKGKVMISGYPSEMYREALADWKMTEFDMPNHAAGGKTKDRMTEVIWTNF